MGNRARRLASFATGAAMLVALVGPAAADPIDDVNGALFTVDQTEESASEVIPTIDPTNFLIENPKCDAIPEVPTFDGLHVEGQGTYRCNTSQEEIQVIVQIQIRQNKQWKPWGEPMTEEAVNTNVAGPTTASFPCKTGTNKLYRTFAFGRATPDGVEGKKSGPLRIECPINVLTEERP